MESASPAQAATGEHPASQVSHETATTLTNHQPTRLQNRRADQQKWRKAALLEYSAGPFQDACPRHVLSATDRDGLLRYRLNHVRVENVASP